MKTQIQTGHGTIAIPVLIAIYSISMVTSLPGLAISPILGDLETIFKGASELQLQMLESLPSFIIVPFILLAGHFSVNADKKRIITIGLSIFFICSLVYLFAKTIGLLLFVSALLGIGSGMVIPFSTGLIADYFTGEYRTRQLGIVSSITNMTLVLATLLAGFLAGINWHLSFLVYCFSGISLVFAFFLKPNKSYLRNKGELKKDPAYVPVTTDTWPFRLMLLYYFITLLALTIPLNLSIYMQNLHIGQAGTSGTLISVFFLAITLPGFFINQVIRKFGNNTNFTALICISIGLGIFLIPGGTVILPVIGVILIGLGYGTMQPIIYDKTVSSVVPSHATFALALVMAMNYIAIITSPFIQKWLASLFSHTASSYFPFILSTVIAVAFTIFTYFRRETATLGMKPQDSAPASPGNDTKTPGN